MKNSHKKSDMFPSIMRETSFTDHLFACLSIACLATFIIHLFVSSDNPLIRIFFNNARRNTAMTGTAT